MGGTGAGYTLVATGTGLSTGTSGAFTVTPLGYAIDLAISTNQPTTATAGTPFMVTVDAVDGFGNTDPDSMARSRCASQ